MVVHASGEAAKPKTPRALNQQTGASSCTQAEPIPQRVAEGSWGSWGRLLWAPHALGPSLGRGLKVGTGSYYKLIQALPGPQKYVK